MTRAEICIPRTLAHEGGYVNNPKDPGGPTNKGITIATFRKYIKPGGSVADLRALTTAQATIVYKRQYWDKVLADLLPAGVDHATFDYAVNSGWYQAAKDLQRTVGATADGHVGPQTLAAVAKMAPADIINGLCDRRLALMMGLDDGEWWKEFGGGSEKRVARVRAGSLADAAHVYKPFVRPDAPAPYPTPPAAPMRHFGTKEIIATAMTRQAYNDYRGWTLPSDERGDDTGYLVEYVDGGASNHPDHAGYISWSPADVFDRAYQPTTALSFGHAIAAMQSGHRVARSGWNGKGMFLYLVPSASYPAQTGAAKAYWGDDAKVPYGAYIAMKTAQENVVPWLASQTDMLANDWQVVVG